MKKPSLTVLGILALDDGYRLEPEVAQKLLVDGQLHPALEDLSNCKNLVKGLEVDWRLGGGSSRFARALLHSAADQVLERLFVVDHEAEALGRERPSDGLFVRGQEVPLAVVEAAPDRNLGVDPLGVWQLAKECVVGAHYREHHLPVWG